MSPFANLLKTLRIERGLRQGELSKLVGYEQSYISALEIGLQGPPNEEFVMHLVGALKLSQVEQETLNQAVAASQRKIIVPQDASIGIYRLFHKFRQQIDHLHPMQIELIETALNLPLNFHMKYHSAPPRIRRRYSKTNLSEAKM